MIVLIRLISDVNATQWIGQMLTILFRVIKDPHMNDDDKVLTADIIGRLARIPTGYEILNLTVKFDTLNYFRFRKT